MSTVTITWKEPTKRSDGSALNPADIRESEVSVSADNGATWSVLASVKPGQTMSLSKDLADGAYKFRVITIDTLGQRGIPAFGDALVKTAPPAAPSITSIVVN